MDQDSSEDHKKDSSTVACLQAALFPSTPRSACGSFFANFYLKPPFLEELNPTNKPQELKNSQLIQNNDGQFTPQAPRWPTECQVLEGKVTHILDNPPVPEPYYVPTGQEPQSKPSGDEYGIIVFQYSPISAVNYFSRSSVGGSRYLLPSCLCPGEDTLRFESRFESGNLAKAIKITPNYYELYLRADMYTNRHMQWYYFRITNNKKNFLYRFSIVNMTKIESLYNEGMRPLMYSVKDSKLHSVGWRRCGDNITYFSNDEGSPEESDQESSYTLSFTIEFSHDDDTIYFAQCYPYTYSDLEDYLTELSSDPIKSSFVTTRLLCKTLAGNNVHCITINPQTSGKKKRSVVITARVHPGETPASWIMKGILDFLTSDHTVARDLREKFIFKLVPMLNPDGVIVGNSRCSLSAKDLNRQYRTVMREAYPSIWYTKLMVRRLMEECDVAMYCDLHAHSRKHNIFIYGCENKRAEGRKLQEQIFPLMMHKNSADKFSFEDCKFRVQKSKEGTGRVVMWMMGIVNSYTMECSFAGSMMGSRANTHFSIQDYEAIGKCFCQTLLDYFEEDPKKERLKEKIVNKLMNGGSSADEPTNVQLSEYSSDEGDTGSDGVTDFESDCEKITPPVPPPTPVPIKKKYQRKVNKVSSSAIIKVSDVTRKFLPVYKATLGLNEFKKKSESETNLNSDEEETDFKRKKWLKLKKKTKLKKLEKNDENQPKVPVRCKRNNSVKEQLSEVKTKLVILKKQLWFGLVTWPVKNNDCTTRNGNCFKDTTQVRCSNKTKGINTSVKKHPTPELNVGNVCVQERNKKIKNKFTKKTRKV